MAEIVVSFALEQVVQLLHEEATLIGGVHKEFVEIKNELQIIQNFLKDADRRASDEENLENGIKIWVKKLRELSFRIEDVIAEYNIYVAHETNHPHRCIALLQKIFHSVKTLMPLRQLAYEIQDIKSSVHNIKEGSKSYNFQSEDGSSSAGRNQSGKWHDPRLVSLFIEESEVVGFEKPTEQLVGWLMNGATARTVISVVGMGGLGKTTLAKKVFDSQQVKGHFDCCAFIIVSQSYAIESLLKSLLNKFCEETKELLPQDIKTMDKMSLITAARHYLQNKRYVIFFDDVWKLDFWDEIQLATLNNNKGSRIVITTRNLDVANYCKKDSHVQVHKLQPLSPNKAWELFCKKAFQTDFSGNCPLELKDMSNEIVKKCEGLPLAIVAIGGLMSTKDKTVFEWSKICQNLSVELERNPHLTSLTRILCLSYDDLPYYLKSCILYFGIYPEDYSIRCTRLVRQWIAEGFVINQEVKPLEEVAREYLLELIHRSLVQVSKVDYDGKALSCRIHDLLREIIIRKMKDLSFCRVVYEGDQQSFDATARRLAVATTSNDALRSITQHTSIRSMFMFEASELPDHFMKSFFSKSKLVKVLDFEGTSLNYVPYDLGSIFHLRYLSLRKTNVKDIPKSIGKLHNLETLDLKETLVRDLPSEINKLTKLRHLLVYHRDTSYSINGETGVRLKENIGNLTFLQKLYHVEADHGGFNLITELRKLRQLRKLGLKNVKMEYGNILCDSIQEMNCLETLYICSITEDETIDLQFISSLPQLRRLHLFGRLEKFPNCIPRLEYLVRLSIRFSKLKDDPLKSLKDLPNLMRLSISGEAYVGEKLHFEVGFQKLKRLFLMNLSKLSFIVLDNGTLPALERVNMMGLPQLKELPPGFHLLQNLENMYLTDMSNEFNKSIDPNDGPMYWVIQHVQMVSIREKVGPNYRYRTICHPKEV
ncbi:disease resistance protein RPM1-like [Abrus precatorius]|uniref:Disease resistance protein RPM1-like n=1 Tax=Abrus precatorius TaxID=3816 RepID=A0A8B8KDM3_ABRPR|nr:disease resistance protein RPM1-like [Abrus precatorius]XP_027341304.1 disease resistance protein RPM1-like [Abrus precatorius]